MRTQRLGNLASPNPKTLPIKMIETLWRGKLPPFNTLNSANELIDALVMGPWNRLARHQERSVPFRLSRIDVPAVAFLGWCDRDVPRIQSELRRAEN
jgi:hypothetical protein